MTFRSLGESLHREASPKLTFAELLYRIGLVVTSNVPAPVTVRSLRGGVLTLSAGSRLEASEVQLRLGTIRERLRAEFPSTLIDHIRIVVRG